MALNEAEQLISQENQPVGTLMSKEKLIKEGDEVVIYVKFGVAHSVKVTWGQTLQMQFGALRHDFLVGKPFGSRVPATKGYVYVLRPTPELWTQILRHRTQILYTPDISIIVMMLELKPGSVVLEAGTGSGALSHAFARTVYPNGHLYTYDVEEYRVDTARNELTEHGFGKVVTCALGNVCSEGFGEENVADGVFLDLPKPWEAVEFAKMGFKESGGRFCSFSPCIEQTQKTCDALRKLGFVALQTVECVPRQLKMIESRMSIMKPKSEQGTLTVAKEDTEIPAAKRRRNEEPEYPAEEMSFRTLIPFPAQQPTHTGYLTTARLPRKK